VQLPPPRDGYARALAAGEFKRLFFFRNNGLVRVNLPFQRNNNVFLLTINHYQYQSFFQPAAYMLQQKDF
jgi:hypothetical protein